MSNNQSAFRSSLSVLGKLFLGTRKGTSGERARLLRNCQKTIGVRFTDLSLLEQALTHRSYSHVTAQTRNDSNERMEFLGDSVLGLSVSQFLYLRFPDRSEGALSKMKSLLVSRKVLSSVSRDCGLGEYILLSGEESEMGGRDRASILADSFEGVIGAIYLDQGYRAANRFIQRFLLANISGILDDDEHTNYKSLLQEYVQSKRLSHPVYRVRKEEGPEHEKEFAIDVVVKGQVWGTGRGKSKKDAEQAAARAALEQRQSEAPRKRGRGRGAQVSDDEAAPPRTGSTGRAAREPRESREGREPREEGRAARPRRAETTATESPRASRSRGRGRPEEAPDSAEAVDRGGHGIAASRESLRRAREEASQEPRVERKGRSRSRSERVERAAPADAPETARSETTRSEAARSETADRPARSSRRRRGGRGSGERRRAEEARATSEEPSRSDAPVETESGAVRSRREPRDRDPQARESQAREPRDTGRQRSEPSEVTRVEPTPAASRGPEPPPVRPLEPRPEATQDAPGFVRRRRRTERPRTTADATPPPEAAPRAEPSVRVAAVHPVVEAPRAGSESPPAVRSEAPREPASREPASREPASREPAAQEPAAQEPSPQAPAAPKAPEEPGANGSSSFVRRKKRSSRGLRRR